MFMYCLKNNEHIQALPELRCHCFHWLSLLASMKWLIRREGRRTLGSSDPFRAQKGWGFWRLNSEVSHLSLFHYYHSYQTVLCHESLVLSYLHRAIWSNLDNVLDTTGFQMHLNSIWLLLERDKPSPVTLVKCSRFLSKWPLVSVWFRSHKKFQIEVIPLKAFHMYFKL